MTVSWTNEKGLKLYINGDLVSESRTPEQRLFFKPCFDSQHNITYIVLFFMFVFFGGGDSTDSTVSFMSRHYVNLQDGDN